MEEKYINRYLSLKKSLSNLKLSCGEDPEKLFVLPATAQNFNLTFDLSWKVMKELLLQEFGIADFISGSPRDTLRAAFSAGLISDDTWMKMLTVRNTLVHDYDGEVAVKYYDLMTGEYCKLMEEFVDKIGKYYS